MSIPTSGSGCTAAGANGALEMNARRSIIFCGQSKYLSAQSHRNEVGSGQMPLASWIRYLQTDK